MPIYEYACPRGHIYSMFCRVADHSPIDDCDCGEVATQIIGAPLQLKIQPECHYDSPITGEPITSWAARTEDLARSNCVPYDPGQKQDYDRRLKAEDEALDKAVHQHVEQAIEKMPTKERGKLWNEVTRAGADLSFERH